MRADRRPDRVTCPPSNTLPLNIDFTTSRPAQGFSSSYDSPTARLRSAVSRSNERALERSRLELGFALRRLDALEKSLKSLSAAVPPVDAAAPTDPVSPVSPTVSGNALSLASSSATPARLTSSEPVNSFSSSVSLSTRTPTWADSGSSSQLTITGDYDGSDGFGTFGFKADRGGTVGQNNVQIEVFSPDGDKIAEVDVLASDPIGTVYELGNGLRFSLSAGTLANNDITRLDIVPPEFDPDGSFDDGGAGLDGGQQVGAGTFTLNGVVIDVYADDSVSSVIARINAAGTGVTASLDAAGERVVLTQESAGSAFDIVAENDTSGFLAATKLDAANVTPGTGGGADDRLANIDSLDAVSSGVLRINGVDIAVDVDNDSLNDVLDRIDASGAGVTASLREGAGGFTVDIASDAAQMELADGGTGFLAALGIAEGSYGSAAVDPGDTGDARDVGSGRRTSSYRAANMLEDFRDILQGLFGDSSLSSAAGLGPLQQSIAELLEGVHDRYGKTKLDRLGLVFGEADEGFLVTDKRSRRNLTEALQTGDGTLEKLLLNGYRPGRDGLIEELRELIGNHLRERNGGSAVGSIVDTFA